MVKTVDLAKFRNSKFRLKFKLDDKDRNLIERCGLEKISSDALQIITAKLVPASPVRDGKQTPFKGHPVFKAQHATATCCRGCFAKWHNIPKGRVLSDQETRYAVAYIEAWIKREAGFLEESVAIFRPESPQLKLL